MDVFLGSVDPFDPDGQFIDRGFSYTLAVYYLSGEQRAAAEEKLRKLEQESGKQFTSVWSRSEASGRQRNTIRIIISSIRRNSGRN